jgi:hypothetical protein
MKHIFRRQISATPKAFKTGSISFAMLLLAGIIINSCQKEFEVVVSNGDPISLSASDTILELSQKQSTSNALDLEWTRGSNQGTGSPISYTLQLDLSGNNFAGAITYDMGKAIYKKSFKVEELNTLLAETLGVEAGSSATLEARVIAVIYDEGVEDDISEAVSIDFTSYKQASDVLYILGTATSVGDDIVNAIEMTPTIDRPWEFVYEGELGLGRVFFSETRDDCWCETFYTRNLSDDELMTRNDEGLGCDGPDNKWVITEETEGRYTITIDFITSSILIEPVQLYLIGDGGPNGWNIEDPEPMVFVDGIYTFTGPLGADNPIGEFKFSKFVGNWCEGGWILGTSMNQSITNTSMSFYTGCPPDELDFKWKLAEGEAGDYVITIDLENEVMTRTKQ